MTNNALEFIFLIFQMLTKSNGLFGEGDYHEITDVRSWGAAAEM
jgi:hypothetical protein